MNNFLEIYKYESIDCTSIETSICSDDGESDFLFFSQPKDRELTVSQFYAKCVKYYYSSYLSYKESEANNDYAEFYSELPESFQEIGKAEAILLVKEWWKTLSLDSEELKTYLLRFNGDGVYTVLVNVNDEFNMLVETENEFIFIYTLI